MKADTSTPLTGGRFPPTRWSAILAARSSDPGERRRALDAVAAAYWKPIYKYIRLRWNKSPDAAADLTQEFFAQLIERNILSAFDPRKARLRTFLRVCADRLVANDNRTASRLKRGGGAPHISLDFAAAEAEFQAARPSLSAANSPESIEDFLEKEFLRSIFAAAVDTLRRFCQTQGKERQFRVFQLYDLEDSAGPRPGYKEIARELGIGVTDVTNYLAFARRQFRWIALEKLREMTASEEEFRREARALFGAEPE